MEQLIPMLKPVKKPEVDITAAENGRLTIVDNVYHHLPDAQPSGIETRWGCVLSTKEQAWIRLFDAACEWTPLSLGWIAECGCSMLIVKNLEAVRWQVKPTAEERDRAMSRIIEIGIQVGTDVVSFARVLPMGQSIQFAPTNPPSLRIRCVGDGPAKCSLFAVPR